MLNFLKMCFYCINPNQALDNNDFSAEISIEQLSNKSSKRSHLENIEFFKSIEKPSGTPEEKKVDKAIVEQSTNAADRPTEAPSTLEKNDTEQYGPFMKQISFRETSTFTELKPILKPITKQSLPTASMKFKMIRKDLIDNAF